MTDRRIIAQYMLSAYGETVLHVGGGPRVIGVLALGSSVYVYLETDPFVYSTELTFLTLYTGDDVPQPLGQPWQPLGAVVSGPLGEPRHVFVRGL